MYLKNAVASNKHPAFFLSLEWLTYKGLCFSDILQSSSEGGAMIKM